MSRTAISIGLAALCLAAMGCASTAPAVPAPSATPPAASPDAGHSDIGLFSVEEVRAAVEEGALLVDARGPQSFAKGHIPGAVNIPCNSDVGYDLLPADLARTVIFYCGGPQCSASKKAAMKALERGHQRVGEFKGGYPAWTAAYGDASK